MRTIAVITFLLAVVFLIAVTGVQVASINSEGLQAEQYKALAASLQAAGEKGWDFIKPLLQLVIVLLVLEWFARRIGLTSNLTQLKFSGNIQVVIAALLIVCYCIAVLAGIGGGDLKEIVLIVVGFYFGSRTGRTEAPQPEAGEPKT